MVGEIKLVIGLLFSTNVALLLQQLVQPAPTSNEYQWIISGLFAALAALGAYMGRLFVKEREDFTNRMAAVQEKLDRVHSERAADAAQNISVIRESQEIIKEFINRSDLTEKERRQNWERILQFMTALDLRISSIESREAEAARNADRP